MASESPCPPVCAVVVTYHPDGALAQRLAVILGQCTQVIVVDNGSPDSCLTDVPPTIELIRLGRNRGLAAGLNVGLARARDLGFAWAVTLDQDSTPEAGMVQALWTSRCRHARPESVAVVGPRLREERVEHEDHRWVVPHPVCRWFFRRASCREQDLPGVAFVITSGALMGLDVFSRIGPMDEGLFIDYIDHDYCLRARRFGYDIMVSAAAMLRHNLGAKREYHVAGHPVRPTFHSGLRLRYMFRNRVILWRRYAWAEPHWALFDGVFTTFNLLRIVLFEDRRLEKVGAAMRGTLDGMLGRRGRIDA